MRAAVVALLAAGCAAAPQGKALDPLHVRAAPQDRTAALHPLPASRQTQPSFVNCKLTTLGFKLIGDFPASGTVSGRVQDSPCPNGNFSGGNLLGPFSVTPAGGGRSLFACDADGAVLCNGDGSNGPNPSTPAVCEPVGRLGCSNGINDISVSSDWSTVYAVCGYQSPNHISFCQWNAAVGVASNCATLADAGCPGSGTLFGVAFTDTALLLGCWSEDSVAADSGVLICPLAPGGGLADPCTKRGENPCGGKTTTISVTAGGLSVGCSINGGAYCALDPALGPSGCGPIPGFPCYTEIQGVTVLNSGYTGVSCGSSPHAYYICGTSATEGDKD
eukprot:TRINITY_DN8868_c0_g1_i3.p1 TRINITY_DN8868_c0_g1~~TRINITY_DN8868_c0_g1_i3.p1  ORF type:complete len:333 (+),score=58.58 TRINITY_DN8868_c0_g1_i3:78-1076(+)